MNETGETVRRARIDALRRVYAWCGESPAAFAWGTSELLGFLAGLARDPGHRWPPSPGAFGRVLSFVSRVTWLAPPAVWLMRLALILQRARIRWRRSGAGLPPRVADGGPCRPFLVFGAANEDRIARWRGAAVPADPLRWGNAGTPGVDLTPSPPSGATSASRHLALVRDVLASLSAARRAGLPPCVAVAVLWTCWRRAPRFLSTWGDLERLSSRREIVEVLASTLDERTFAAGAWASAAPGRRATWVQHGFLALDILPWAPGVRHHGYDDSHGELARAAGAPRGAIGDPVGLAYFESRTFEPSPTVLVASQGRIPFALPVGRGAEPCYAACVAAARRSGWEVLRRPHRIEGEHPALAHDLPGVTSVEGAGTLTELIARCKPSVLLSVWSTGALDALACDCLPVFVLSRSGMREHCCEDLDRYGVVIDVDRPDAASEFEAQLGLGSAELRRVAGRRRESLLAPGAPYGSPRSAGPA